MRGAVLRIHKTIPLLEPTPCTCDDLLGDGSKLSASLSTFDCPLGVVIVTAVRLDLLGGVIDSSAATSGSVDAPSEALSSRRLLEGVVEP